MADKPFSLKIETINFKYFVKLTYRSTIRQPTIFEAFKKITRAYVLLIVHDDPYTQSSKCKVKYLFVERPNDSFLVNYIQVFIYLTIYTVFINFLIYLIRCK